jgi:flagellar basal-body rod modification protein FlgD
MEINQTGLLGAGSKRAEVASASLADNFDNFLTLLTTQLQNQDPLSPMESTEFTNQLVQFASVEQQIAQNQSLEELLAIQRSNQAVSAVGFLGTVVEAFGDSMMLENGSAEFSYTLLPDTDSTKISIIDSSGGLVRTFDGEKDVGKHNFVWDGLDGQGLPAPDGVYQIRVAARNGDGDLLDSATSVFGNVSAIAAEDGVVVLKFGEVSVPIANVVAVKNATLAQTGQPAVP